MKKKKGFTLIELLAVIVILSIILLIAVPQVTKLIEGARDKSYTNSEELLSKAAKNYVGGEDIDLPENVGARLEIPYTLLLNMNYITKVLDPVTNEECINSSVYVTKINDIKYTFTPVLQCPSYNPGTVASYRDTRDPVMNIDDGGYEWPYYAQDLSVTLTPTDCVEGDPETCGIKKFRYGVSTDGGVNFIWSDWIENSDPVTIVLSDLGVSQIKTETFDNLGNFEVKTSQLYNIIDASYYVRFGENNPSNGASSSTLPIVAEFNKASVDSIYVTFNGNSYYVYGTDVGSSGKSARSCKDIYTARSYSGGTTGDGIYFLNQDDEQNNDVYCDMDSTNSKALYIDFGTDNPYGAALKSTGISSTSALASVGCAQTSPSGAAYQDFNPNSTYISYRHFTYDSWYTSGVSCNLPSYYDMVLANTTPSASDVVGYCAGSTVTEGSYSCLYALNRTVGIAAVVGACYASYGINNLWLWEAADNLVLANFDTSYDVLNYTFNNLSTGVNTYSVTAIVNGDSYTISRTIIKN